MSPPSASVIASPTPTITTTTTTVFSQFDVVSDDPTDHYFFKKSDTKAAAAAGGGAEKKIMQEWRVLENNLPDTIFVRVYESRISLLRAAIVGTPGTPYHDNLFFFDISLPSDYPSRPPLVHYCSSGYRINPNLYATGHVCLSLLNTWLGDKSEKWDRTHSTLLQVLVSIQALVMNEKPYFNEPGYAGSRGKKMWEKKAAEYNQNVFVLSCKTALNLIRNPPRSFEPLVTAHYRDRAVAILTACDAYRSGRAAVGGMKRMEVSSRFDSAVEKVYGELVASFARNGAAVESFVQRLADVKEEKAKRKEKEAEERKKARGAVRKILDKIWMRTGF